MLIVNVYLQKNPIQSIAYCNTSIFVSFMLNKFLLPCAILSTFCRAWCKAWRFADILCLRTILVRWILLLYNLLYCCAVCGLFRVLWPFTSSCFCFAAIRQQCRAKKRGWFSGITPDHDHAATLHRMCCHGNCLPLTQWWAALYVSVIVAEWMYVLRMCLCVSAACSGEIVGKEEPKKQTRVNVDWISLNRRNNNLLIVIFHNCLALELFIFSTLPFFSWNSSYPNELR